MSISFRRTSDADHSRIRTGVELLPLILSFPLLCLSLLLEGCIVGAAVQNVPTRATTSSSSSTSGPAPLISNLNLQNNTLIISGNNFSGVTQVGLIGAQDIVPVNLEILTSTSRTITAAPPCYRSGGGCALDLLLGETYSLIVSNAYGSSAVPFVFNLTSVPTDGLVVGTTELVTAGGKVGIGTANPLTPLQVSGDALLFGKLRSASF